MIGLSAGKLASLNLAVRDIYAAAWKGKFVETLPDIIARLLPGELAIGSLLTSAGALRYAATKPVVLNLPEIFAGYARWGQQHPTLGRRPKAQSISDHLSRRNWQRTALYVEVMRDLEVQDDLGLDVTLDERQTISFCMWRRKWVFAQEERAMFDLLGSHMQQAWGQNERMKRRTGAGIFPESLEHALGHGVIRVDPRGRVLAWTARTRAQLESFTGSSRSASHLPPQVLAWFRAQCQRHRENRQAENPHTTLRLESQETALDIQFVAEATRDEYYLVMEEKPTAAHSSLLGPLGLSSREQEVLFWIAEGKSNQAVAQILGISIHTVKRHLEKIYAKLELDGRHAASSFVQKYLQRAQSPE